MSKKIKVIEICKNLENTIKRINGKSIIRSENPMFDSPTANVSKLKYRQKELMEKYNLTKKDLK
tara:strand:+ start:265 stop:456 length:192 start_codon:yes stop_codon:yes gene_type:complete